MIYALLLPTLVVVATSFASVVTPVRVAPALTTKVLTLALVAAAGTSTMSLAAISFSYLAQLPRLAGVLGWCGAVVSHHDRTLPELGVASTAALLAMSVAGARAGVHRRRTVRQASVAQDVALLDTERPVAYAVPGRPGQVVISTGMLRCLDADERQVLLAHERAHLAHHHHRYLAVGEVAVAALPMLRPALARLRLATERWADETAAAVVGDRALVARAIARAALAGHSDATSLAFTGSGVVSRVEALVGERDHRFARTCFTAAALAAVTAATAAGSGVELHHVVIFVERLCG